MYNYAVEIFNTLVRIVSLPVKKQMKPVDIQYELKKLGFTQADLARTLNVSDAVISNTILGRATSWPVAQHIAALIGKVPKDLWPDRYCFKPRPARSPAGEIRRLPNKS